MKNFPLKSQRVKDYITVLYSTVFYLFTTVYYDVPLSLGMGHHYSILTVTVTVTVTVQLDACKVKSIL